jgi:hypothetical protein
MRPVNKPNEVSMLFKKVLSLVMASMLVTTAVSAVNTYAYVYLRRTTSDSLLQVSDGSFIPFNVVGAAAGVGTSSLSTNGTLTISSNGAYKIEYFGQGVVSGGKTGYLTLYRNNTAIADTRIPGIKPTAGTATNTWVVTLSTNDTIKLVFEAEDTTNGKYLVPVPTVGNVNAASLYIEKL